MGPENVAARIARYFLHSKLTPALVVAICVFGIVAILATPREENPQITMPAATIVTRYPGASAQEVQQLVTERGERVLQEVPGIEHVYATSTQDASYLTVLFHVGDDPTKSFVDLYDQIFAHLNELPPGAAEPQITPLSVDDIPIVVLTLHGRFYDRGQLYAASEGLVDRLRTIDGVSTIATYGGRPREVDVTLDPVRLAAYGLAPGDIARSLGATNRTADAGTLRGPSSELQVRTGTPYANVDQVAAQIVAVHDGQPVELREVAHVAMTWTPEESQTLVGSRSTPSEAAVNLAIAKKPGSNAVAIAERVRTVVDATALPPGIAVTVTRDYGEKANDAVNELIQRLVEAIAIVVVLLLVLGWRQALVVATAIPLTVFVTLGIAMLAHQTINRITLFALILALGLLVDDAIVLVENIHRHYAGDPQAPRDEAAIRAVGEIGSPTALATLTVILSFLPMLFVTGMMGPYMRPIPLNVPVAMAASLFIAFAITPWATYHLLKGQKMRTARGAPRWVAPFPAALGALLDRPAWRRTFLVLLLLAFVGSLALPAVKLVNFRMLPDANESTFLVAIDAPAGSTLANTVRITDRVGAALGAIPEVTDYEIFAGTSSIPDLSSLLEGTIFRNAPNQADIRVNLVKKERRRIASAALVSAIRPRLQAIAQSDGATVRILQTPPGPPVRDTILAKIYGPDPDVRRTIAARITGFLTREPGVVDVDPSTKAQPGELRVAVDQREAALAGVDVQTIDQTLATALTGAAVSTLHTGTDPRPVAIFLRFAPAYRHDPDALGSVMLPARGGLVPLASIANIDVAQAAEPMYRGDGENVTYVGADMAGRSSTYAVIDALVDLAHRPLPDGYRVDWDGEWDLTLTVFADLGRAMALAFLLIYFVLVARFRSFRTPFVVLAAVPLAFIGIMPGFALLAPGGVYFSATSMIGLIALIGIVVRNSIILIEFIEDKAAEGLALREALLEAAAARTRPIFLTAAAGVLSSVVIASDPVWSGLAWALVFGMTTSAVLSVIAVPLLYAGVAPRWEAVRKMPANVATHARTIVTFPELGGHVTESTTLPRLVVGETIALDAEVFRGAGDAVDAVAHLRGDYLVEESRIVVDGLGSLLGRQEIALRSQGEPPSWQELEHA